ncbi:MAG: hypothetical protein V1804_02535 [Patescibacteria group bacterium]
MKIFIDFDDVLFNTKCFRKDIRDSFIKNGISGKIFDKYYTDPKEYETGIRQKYNPERHIDRIRKKFKINKKSIVSGIDGLLMKGEKYIFSDVLDFFENFRKNELYIISNGDSGFQKKKIEGSKIKKYFKAVKISDRPKSNRIRGMLTKKEKTYFLDDRVEYISEVKKAFPSVITILVKRKEGRYNDEKTKYCGYEVKNLKEALKIIKNENGKK